MSSNLHEVLVEIFRMRPSLAAELLTDALGIEVPRFVDARLEPADFVEITPTEVRADAVVVLSDGSRTVGAVIVEVRPRSGMPSRGRRSPRWSSARTWCRSWSIRRLPGRPPSGDAKPEARLCGIPGSHACRTSCAGRSTARKR
jgi:hypothetical protein